MISPALSPVNTSISHVKIPSRFLITGVVCGVRVEEIQEPMMREIRYLDKLAKGKAMEKILRK